MTQKFEIQPDSPTPPPWWVMLLIYIVTLRAIRPQPQPETKILYLVIKTVYLLIIVAAIVAVVFVIAAVGRVDLVPEVLEQLLSVF